MSDRDDLIHTFLRASAPIVMVDFDGTISDIVATPDAARPVAGAVETLTRLADAGVAVVVLSSRPVSFLTKTLAGVGAGVRLVGHSGFEQLVGGEIMVDEQVADWASVVRAAHDQLLPELPPGVRLEDKGLSFALHFRQEPSAAPAAQEAAARVAAATGLSLKPGRMNVELRPPGGSGQGYGGPGLPDSCYRLGSLRGR